MEKENKERENVKIEMNGRMYDCIKAMIEHIISMSFRLFAETSEVSKDSNHKGALDCFAVKTSDILQRRIYLSYCYSVQQKLKSKYSVLESGRNEGG